MTTPSESARSCPLSAPRLWATLGFFILLAAGLMWPVVAHLSTRVPGTATWAFDEYTFLWNDWYLRHALLDLHTSPLHTNLIWFPLGIDLILYTFNFVNAALALPLQLAANLPLASNVTMLLSTVLSGFGAYLLARDVLAAGVQRQGRREPIANFLAPEHLAALLAGVIFAAGSNRAVYLALGHYNFASSQWLPFYTLYLLRTLRRAFTPGHGQWHAPVMAGLFFACAALTEMTYAAFLALLSVVVVLAVWPDLRKRWPGTAGLGKLAGRLAVAGAVALLLWAPLLAPIAREFTTGGYGSAGWGESITLSADLRGLVTPTDLNPLLSPPSGSSVGAGGDWQAELRAVEEGKGRFRDINTVFLGFVTLALAVLAVVLRATRRQARVWAWVATIFGVLSLGPLLQVGGRFRFNLDGLLSEGVTFPLPFALLHYVPFLNANRAPNRYSLILMLALALLAALTAFWVQDRVARHGREHMVQSGAQPRRIARPGRASFSGIVAGLLVVAVAVEHLAVPLPTTDARVPDVYRQIGAEPGDFSILQLPLGWRDSYQTLGSEDTRVQYYQVLHGKSILGGNISRAPAFKMDYFRRIPLFRALTDLEMYREVPADVDAAARAQAGSLVALYDIRYLVIFPPVPGRYPYQDTAKRVQDYALSVLPVDPTPFWQQDGVKAYRVNVPAPPFPFRLDLGQDATEPYLGAGWDPILVDRPYDATATWIDGRSADLYLPLAAPVASTLRLALAPLGYPGAPQQTVSISVNGVSVLDRQPLAQGWQTLSAPVPASATHRGPNHVHLTFGWAASPRQVFPDPGSRAVIGATGAVSPVNIDAHGFTEAFISVFDREGRETKASAGRRGYNVAVVDRQNGRVLDMQGFDTVANRYQADRLAEYLRGIAPGQIVVIATKGDAAAHLTQVAVDALRGLGSRVQTPSDLAGQAQALVGVQGAAPGSASETIGPADAFVRVSGDFRTLSAAVDWVELGQ